MASGTSLTRPLAVRFIDSGTSQPVANAKLFVDGSAAPAAAPVTGVVGSQILLEGTAPGYDKARLLYQVPPGNVPAAVDVPIYPKAPGAYSDTTFQFSPPASGIRSQLVGPDGVTVVAGGYSTDGQIKLPAAGAAPLPAGNYTLRTQYPGTDPISKPITLSGTENPSFDVTLNKTVDPGSGPDTTNGAASAATQQSVTGLSRTGGNSSSSTPVDPAEAPLDSDWEGYYTGAQVRVYINDLFLDELSTLQWTSQGNQIPIYGYASRFADAFASGRYLVQGQITINYVTEGYLYTVLTNVKDTKPVSQDQADASEIQELLKAKLALVRPSNVQLRRQSVGTSSSLMDPAVGLASTIAANQSRLAAINDRLSILVQNPSAVKLARKAPAAGDRMRNVIEKNILFDIVVEIGTGPNRSVRRLQNCRLTANETLFDMSGKEIGESYAFIARRAR